MYHKLLQKQIRKYLPKHLLDQEDCQIFLQSINNSYQLFERDQELMDHAFTMSEREFAEVNQELKLLANQRLITLKQLNETVSSLLDSNEPADENETLVSLSEKIRRQVDVNKLNQQELYRNINLFKTLLANLQSGILIENENREILFTNDLFCSIFDVSTPSDQLIGADCSRAERRKKYLFKEPEAFFSRIQALLRKREPVYNEAIEIIDGTILERDYVPIFIDGVYRGHFWKYTDVTDEVHYQSILQESEERNRLVMNSSLDAIVISDEEGNIVYWNPRAEQIMGWTATEAIGSSVTELFLPEYTDAARQSGLGNYLNARKNSMLNRELELTAVNKVGKKFPLELVVVTYQQNSKNYFCGFMRDISSRKKSQSLLRAQEEKYRNIITNMNLGLLEVDTAGNVLFTNQSFCDISGYQAKELVGAKASDFLLKEKGVTPQKTKQLLEKPLSPDSYEMAVKNKAGDTRWWFISEAPNYNDEGQLVGSVGIHLDITKQKELESALAVSKDKAEEASVAKEAFLANMSHEIRTPLNAIIGMIRELSREQLSPQQQTYLSHTDTAAKHLLSIVNNILDISKIEAGELKLEAHNFSLQALIANINSILHLRASEKNIQLTSTLSKEVYPAYIGDSARIRQVLINLLDNAIKFTMEGSVDLRVEVMDEDEHHQFIEITISDTGIGMDADYINQIFSKFSQAEKSTSRRFGGTGLGMSITKEIVKLMGGSIEVKSEKDRGTKLKVNITLAKGDVDKLYGGIQNNRHLLEGAHVLLVEDNMMNRFIAIKSLSHFGCTIDEAENGLVALELLKTKTYNVVLMDIQMPELDGVETTKIIRNELKLEVPIIAITANAFKRDIELYLSIGMDDYVTKPFEEKELFNTIVKQLQWEGADKAQRTNIMNNNNYDLSNLKALSRGDEDFVRSMVEIFRQQTPPALEEMKEALRRKDYETLAQTAHRIKPSIENMGITQLDGVAREIELAIKTKGNAVDHTKLTQKLHTLVSTLSAVFQKLDTDFS